MKTWTTPRLHVHPFLELTADKPVQNLSLPTVAMVPLGPDGEDEGEWLVQSGDLVEEEQPIGRGAWGPVFAPIPGRVIRVTSLPNPKGGQTPIAAIALEGTFRRTGKKSVRNDWQDWPSSRIHAELERCAYLATPSALEPAMTLGPGFQPKKIVLNFLQPEPYLSGWYHLPRDFPRVFSTAILILKKLYGTVPITLALHKSPQGYAQDLIREVSSSHLGVVYHGHEYPIAHSSMLSEDRSTLVLDVESLFDLVQVVEFSRPQIDTFVTVSGSGVLRPGVYRVRIGTPVSVVLEECGRVPLKEATVVLGGPFRGYRLTSEYPITRLTRAVLVLGPQETKRGESVSCIRCGACVDACPVGINPIRLYEGLSNGDGQILAGELNRCIECGICSAVCPSRLPLLNTFRLSRRPRP